MAFDTIIFDLDGTLVDTADDLTASLNHALRTLGRPVIDPDGVRAMVGHGARKLLERGLAATGEMTPELVEAGVRPFLEHYGANIAVHSRPFDAVEGVLDELEGRGLKLAICTNKPVALAESLVAELGWGGRFRALLGADSRPWRKPDPRHLRETLAEAGGERAVFVGDSKTDADTALAAGVPLVLVSFGYSTEPVESLGADELIGHYSELLPALGRIQAGFNAGAQKSGA
ncbi:phosphoglycolate phosphatase [Sandaracinobacter sp. RS1-74]|uniref:HAD family hydrolase n=1 Tax=Sandaracinobacteroides sayramensis TaxID=2913411 RepID=UPI001EDA63BC|nr:HAD family hydrolase [Sandaracinobacteroides sayramensis]MCG2841492.1 phosphoglycolate phosphatase [Sandaracinobacteroides sayramensis]